MTGARWVGVFFAGGWVLVCLFAWALCRAAAQADRAAEEYWRRRRSSRPDGVLREDPGGCALLSCDAEASYLAVLSGRLDLPPLRLCAEHATLLRLPGRTLPEVLDAMGARVAPGGSLQFPAGVPAPPRRRGETTPTDVAHPGRAHPERAAGAT